MQPYSIQSNVLNEHIFAVYSTYHKNTLYLARLHILVPKSEIRQVLMYIKLNKLINIIKILKVRKRAKIRNQYNQAPHLTQDTNGKVTTSQLDITNEIQEVSRFTASDHKALINRRARKHNKNKTERLI